jgi:hypothetical protein
LEELAEAGQKVRMWCTNPAKLADDSLAGAGLSTHCEGVQVHVGQVVGPGEAGIAGVAANADVGHPVVERQTVERRVRFDEPPVRLRR